MVCSQSCLFRVDAPYKPITDHGTGKRMGGGKGSIDEYATPVRLATLSVIDLVCETQSHLLSLELKR